MLVDLRQWTRRVRLVRGEGRGVSGWYGVAEEGRGIDHHVKSQELKALGAIGTAPAHAVQHPERLLLPARRRAVVHGQPRLDGHLADAACPVSTEKGHGVSGWYGGDAACPVSTEKGHGVAGQYGGGGGDAACPVSTGGKWGGGAQAS